MLNIPCQSCNFNNKVQYDPSVGGKKIMFKCKNKVCKEFITIKLPKGVKATNSTIVVEKTKIVRRAQLELEENNEIIRYNIESGVSVIGRKSESKFPDICLNVADSSISRMHCMIECLEDSGSKLNYILKDYKSKNGVFLNGVLLSKYDEVYLRNNDEIQLGTTSLKFTTIE